jgi:hypothetical protein
MNDEARLAALQDGSAWDDFCEHLKSAGRSVIDRAPEDVFDRAEGLRYVGRIARHALQNFMEERDAQAPVIGGLPKLGGDNPDYVYTSAALSGEHVYRLRGQMGESSYLGIGSYAGEVGTEEGLSCSGYLDGSALSVEADGSYEVRIACEKQEGNWLPMEAKTSQLMIRELMLDRRNQRSGSFEIERVGGDDAGRPLEPLRYAGQLAGAGAYVEGAIAQFLDWTEAFAAKPNTVPRIPEHLQVAAQGDPNTHYYGGYYEVSPGEALLIEIVPPECEYWNLQLCNHWLESLDYTRHTVSVNHHTAVADDRGVVRIVVTHRDPGLPNWLDTAGHERGCIILRQVGTPKPYDPVCRVVPLADLLRKP